MANDSTGAMQELSALIAEIEAGAYARGQSDARKELLDILVGDGEKVRLFAEVRWAASH